MGIILTGDRPTGRLHLGHYVGSLACRVKMQHEHKQFIIIADTQALTDNFTHTSLIQENIELVATDYIAVGIDPEKTTIFVQSAIRELFELSYYYMNFVTLSRLKRNPTVKAEMQQKGYDDSSQISFICYPISQTADITAFRADLVPVGADQIPIIEQANEIIHSFNSLYKTDYLKKIEVILSTVPRLIGIDGKAKASKSLNNAIYLCDTTDAVKKKVWSMFTDPNHLKVSDPGRVEGNVVFTYLDAFLEDKELLQSLKLQYQKGGLGDSTIKELLFKTLEAFLQPIRTRYASIKPTDIKELIHSGNLAARAIAKETTHNVRNIMGLSYE